MKRRRSIPPRCRLGTAMTEFALALPLLVVVLALIWLMGLMHMRKQRVVVASRYTVWRSFEEEGAPDDDELNALELNNRAEAVEQDHVNGYTDTLDAWIDAAGDEDPLAAALADELLMGFSHNRRARVVAWYPPPEVGGVSFGEDLSFSCGRAGLEWLRGQESQQAALREMYYADLDADLANYSGPAADMATRLRGLWNWGW